MLFRENPYRVLIVSAAEKFNAAMMPLLPQGDYWPVRTAASVAQARRDLAQQPADLVLINTPLKDDFGKRLAIDLSTGTDAAVLLLAKSELCEELSAQLIEFGVTVLAKPTSPALMNQSLRALCAMRERLRRVAERQTTLEERMEEIRLVNRAKWVLIEQQGMEEEQAHRYLEKRAMDLRVSKTQVAREILQSADGENRA